MMDPLKKTRLGEMSTRSPQFEYQTKPGISINQPTNRQSLVMQRSEKSEASVCGKKVRMTPSQQIGRVEWIARSRGVLPGAFPVLEKQHCFSFKWTCIYILIFLCYLKIKWSARVFIGVDQLLYTPWIGCHWFNMQ